LSEFGLRPQEARSVWPLIHAIAPFDNFGHGEPMVTETVLSFCSPGNCTNGSEPYAGLIMDKSGNLYGTTWANGLHGGGTVFEQ
jgi:hypothetical protein